MLLKDKVFTAVLLLFSCTVFSYNSDTPPIKNGNIIAQFWGQFAQEKYACLNDTSMSYDAFQEGLQGYYLLKKNNKLANGNYLTIIDFSKHSSENRFFLIDMITLTIIHKTLCAHGKNTGGAYATKFSNLEGSNQTSLGFYITGETYKSKFNLGLRLDGLESSNNKARSRGVVMHGAQYATASFLNRNNNVLGRSFGCPAVPMEEADLLINLIKNGSLMYIYHPDKTYHVSSKLLNNFEFISRNQSLAEALDTI
jgi:hypothetical protein